MVSKYLILLSWFEKERGELVGEEIIHGISNQKLCQVLDIKFKDYPFRGVCFPINESLSPYIQKLATHTINFSQYNYFLEEIDAK